MRQMGLNLRAHGSAQALAATWQARHRAQSGTTITYAGIASGGQAYAAITGSVMNRDHEYLPDGARNAADADLRVFSVNAGDFVDATGAAAWPESGETVTWEGQSYTITAVRPEDAGARLALRLLCFRVPPPSTADDAATDPQAALFSPPPI